MTSTPAGINCGGTCLATYGFGTVVTLTSASAPVASWAGCDSVTATTCTVTLASSRTVSVNFL